MSVLYRERMDETTSRLWPCPCCNRPTLHEEPPGTFEICPTCGWEDDNVQFNDPTFRGANELSLLEHKSRFEKRRGVSSAP
jgi:Cysteine-rich CPCC